MPIITAPIASMTSFSHKTRLARNLLNANL